jgi:hypothetical protein
MIDELETQSRTDENLPLLPPPVPAQRLNREDTARFEELVKCGFLIERRGEAWLVVGGRVRILVSRLRHLRLEDFADEPHPRPCRNFDSERRTS